MLNYRELADWVSQLEEDIRNQNHERFGMHSDAILLVLARATKIERSSDKDAMQTVINLDRPLWMKIARHIRGAQANIRRGDFSLALGSLQEARRAFEQKAAPKGQ